MTVTPARDSAAACAVGGRPVRFGGRRRHALALEVPEGASRDEVVRYVVESSERAEREGAALGYAFVEAEAEAALDTLGWVPLGPVPTLERSLRLSPVLERWSLPGAVRSAIGGLPLVAPFGRDRRAGVREITGDEPRVTRLWDRFSIDVGVAIERNASYLERRVLHRHDAGQRVLIFEDGDRYAIRAMCAFAVGDDARGRHGRVTELLHDRSVTGMRAASHLLGLALREMLDAGAETARAWSLAHSGSYPIYARHAFLAPPRRRRSPDLRFRVRVFDPDLAAVVTQRDRWYLSLLDLEPG